MEKILIAGLGNPGEKYEKTRHNIGFMVLNSVADELKKDPYFLDTNFEVDKKSNSLLSVFNFNGKKFYFVKPQTFMNESGFAIKKLKDYFDIDDENLFIIHDDLDLPLGKLRVREKGSSAGHNGLKSIIAHIGTSDFKRLKIGIGNPEKGSPGKVISFVTGKFREEEAAELPKIIEEAKNIVMEKIIK